VIEGQKPRESLSFGTRRGGLGLRIAPACWRCDCGRRLPPSSGSRPCAASTPLCPPPERQPLDGRSEPPAREASCRLDHNGEPLRESARSYNVSSRAHRRQLGGVGRINAGRVAKTAGALAQGSDRVQEASLGCGLDVKDDVVGVRCIGARHHAKGSQMVKVQDIANPPSNQSGRCRIDRRSRRRRRSFCHR